MERGNKKELGKRISKRLSRTTNINKLNQLILELTSLGFAKDIIDSCKNENKYNELTDEQLLTVAHRIDKVLNESIFKTFYGKSWADEPDFGNDLSFDNNCNSLHIYHYNKIYDNYYLGYTSINELYNALSYTSPIVHSIIDINSLSDLTMFSQIDDVTIHPMILYTDAINVIDGEFLSISDAIINCDSLYMFLVLKKYILNANTDIPIYLSPKEHHGENSNDKFPESYYKYVSLIREQVRNDINHCVGYDVILEIDNLRSSRTHRATILSSITDCIYQKYFLNYKNVIKGFATYLDDIVRSGKCDMSIQTIITNAIDRVNEG